MFSILDIEATGGYSKNGRMTEIAIYRHDGNKVVDEFTSLINPEMPIPPFVQRLTGINNEMVRSAPAFKELAEQVHEITKNSILVAHNVKADYGFLKAEFESAGHRWRKERLCTLQISKELIPGIPSYSLGKLCKSLEIPHDGHHRAASDALATVKLFEHLLSINPDQVLKFKRKP